MGNCTKPRKCTIKTLVVFYRNLLKPKKSYIQTGIFYENFPLHANFPVPSVQTKLSDIHFNIFAVRILTGMVNEVSKLYNHYIWLRIGNLKTKLFSRNRNKRTVSGKTQSDLKNLQK